VKAVLTAVDGVSFLEAKLVQTTALEREIGVSVPVALMTSFATDEVIRDHVAERKLGDPLVFNQFVSLRLERRESCSRRTAAVAVCAGARGPLQHCAAPARSHPARPRRPPRDVSTSTTRCARRSRMVLAPLEGGGR
jgi:hypothetical protein